jgi:hypothetical protein
MDVGGGDMTTYKLSMFGVAWCRITITSGPLRAARTAARAAGRSDLSDHIHGAHQLLTCGAHG